MQKIRYYLLPLVALVCMFGCTQQETEEFPEAKTLTIRLRQGSQGWTRLIDEDNLAVEQTIKNLSVFFTDPSSTTIAYKYVYTGFSLSGEEQIITLPLEAADLQTKNVYVVANYDSESELNAVTNMDGMRALFTPEADKASNLNPIDGFCMFGHTDNVDFTDSANLPVYVELTRTCAKFRINLSFPESGELSTNNSFLILNAAKYTHVMENLTEILPLTDYFNFATALPLRDSGQGNYTNTIYTYEAAQAPSITIYTHLNNSTEEQAFTARLPIPQRNYLYDLEVLVYEENPAAARSAVSDNTQVYNCQSTISVYNEYGVKTEELSGTFTLQ